MKILLLLKILHSIGGDIMIYLFLAEGFEESEAIIPLDMLRRAGIEVKTVGLSAHTVCGSHGIEIGTDCLMEDFSADTCDGIILPGGMPGTKNLFADERLLNAVRVCAKNNKLLAAICAAPLIFGRLGLLQGKHAVCFPGFENELSGAVIDSSPAVSDGNIITAAGAGAAFEFSYEIISYIKNKDCAQEILRSVQFGR